MIRLILIIIFLLLFAVFSIPMFLIQFFVGKINPDQQFRIAQCVTRNVFRVILFLSGTKKTVRGVENIPRGEAVVYVSNHRGYFDIMLAYSTVPTLTSFIAKKEIGKFPGLRTWMSYMKCLFLDRENIREGLKTILQGIEQLKEGYSVFIMPEGTRNSGTEMLPFHEGSFKLAEKSGCAIVPVAITNTETIFEAQFPRVRSQKAAIQYGKPVYMKDMAAEDRKRIGAYMRDQIQNMINEIENTV